MSLNMNIVCLKHNREEISELAYEALVLEFGPGCAMNTLRFTEFSLGTLRQLLMDLPETHAVLALSLPVALRMELADTNRVSDPGWSLGSLPIYVWDLFGGPDGKWVSVGRMRAQALPRLT